ncbi:hypothetical protein J2X31_002631 [Flavobacterium arsenatis]|uniref:DNA polymerase III subunit gamma/tau n=1 Tax=Flavobacterium arsenatis TaxID=1484332 RepID=A0ABU1TRV4_9FLAO|nr:DNA polymerase III subunit gamma/tau [Flavobacterium arsenatis]MDR6968608.1 hypothetical protein [Flavobacterium arsenatis]
MEIPVQAPELISVPTTVPINEEEADVITVPIPTETFAETPKIETPIPPGTKVSALSLSSIRAKRELEQSHKSTIKDTVHLPTEAFTETDMLLQWNKYAQRLGDKGRKIMESLMLVNDPKLDGTTIIHELPNEGSKIDFEGEKFDLLGYLRGKLHNHDIMIEIVINEAMDSRKAFTAQDRFNRLNEMNPNLELLRKTFDLDI